MNLKGPYIYEISVKDDGGYRGYSWRNNLKKATLHVWCLEGASKDEEPDALECIESEIVFLCRSRLCRECIRQF